MGEEVTMCALCKQVFDDVTNVMQCANYFQGVEMSLKLTWKYLSKPDDSKSGSSTKELLKPPTVT